jgi:hypothetical protein
VLSIAGLAQGGEHKVTICHFTSSSSNPYVAITIDENASAFPHLDSNGNPENGHEQDFLLDFEATAEECEAAANPTPTPKPTSTPAGSQAGTASPSPTSTPEGSQAGGTGTPAASLSNSATSLPGAGGPIATIGFGLALLASLGTLAYANVRSVRSRS